MCLCLVERFNVLKYFQPNTFPGFKNFFLLSLLIYCFYWFIIFHQWSLKQVSLKNKTNDWASAASCQGYQLNARVMTASFLSWYVFSDKRRYKRQNTRKRSSQMDFHRPPQSFKIHPFWSFCKKKFIKKRGNMGIKAFVWPQH